MKNKTVQSLLLFSCSSLLLFSCYKKIPADKNFKADTTVSPAKVATASSPQLSLLWNELPHEAFKEMSSVKMRFKNYRLFALDSLTMQTLLSKAPKEKQRNIQSLKIILELPRPDSGFMKFSIYRTTVMDSALEASYPLLKTYGGQGTDDRTANVRLDFNPNGFHAYVTSQSGEWFIQPATRGITHQYLFCFFKQDVVTPDRKPFEETGVPVK